MTTLQSDTVVVGVTAWAVETSDPDYARRLREDAVVSPEGRGMVAVLDGESVDLLNIQAVLVDGERLERGGGATEADVAAKIAEWSAPSGIREGGATYFPVTDIRELTTIAAGPQPSRDDVESLIEAVGDPTIADRARAMLDRADA